MKESELLKLAREQFAEADEADSTVRTEAQEDLRIYDGSGIWPDRLRMAREGDPKGARPCLVVSDLASRVHQITNDFRQNRPGIKVRPVDDKADVDTAEVFNGVIRHTEEQSMADIAYETANFYQVVTGLGYFRIVEKVYEGKPELCVKQIADPSSVRMDPFAACPVGSDARYAFVTELIPRKDFEREYPNVDLTGWEDGGDDQWVQEDAVRVAEWFRLEERSSNRITKDDGEEVSEEEYWEEAKTKGVKPGTRSTRMDERTVCVWRKLVGNKILKTVELPIRWVPVFRMAGESYVLDGRRVFKGIVRDSRDSVRMVSYNFSSYVEAVALQPKAPFVGAVGQFDGLEDQWAAANSENLAYLEYNPVDVNGQQAPAPKREQPAMAAQGLIQGLVLAKDALKDTSGMGAASLGQKGNETSGKAILARQREGDVGTFHLLDNASKAIRHAGRVLVEWIPKTYDEVTVARILGEDGQADTAYIDPTQKEAMRKVQTAQGIKTIYNIGVGRYDVVASVGPSFTTKRLEMVDTMNQLFQSFPQAFQVLGDIYLSSQDMPGAEKMARRLKAMLPPQAAAADDDGENQMPPEATAQIQQLQQQLQEGASIVQDLDAENQKLRAQLEAKDVEVKAKLYATDVDLQKTQIQSRTQLAIASQNNETKAAIAGLQQMAQQMQIQMQRQQYVIDTLLSMGQQQSAEAQQEHQRAMDMRNADRTDQDMQFNQQMAMQPPAPTEGA